MRRFSRSACRIAATAPFRSSVFPGCALGDVRLQVAEQELRVDRLALVLLGQRVDELRGPRAPWTFTPSGTAAPRLRAARVGDRALRVGDRAELGRVDLARCAPAWRTSGARNAARTTAYGGGRREPADVDAADRDARAGSASASGCGFGGRRRRRRGRRRGVGRRRPVRSSSPSVVVVVSVDGGGDCARADRDERSQRRRRRRAPAAATADSRSGRFKRLTSVVRRRKMRGSFVITPSTPAATTRSSAGTSSTVHASTAAPRACARSTTARETTE